MEEKQCNYMQVGKHAIACGACDKRFEDCKELQKKYPGIKPCTCICHEERPCCNLCPLKYEKGAGITHCTNKIDCPCHSTPEPKEQGCTMCYAQKRGVFVPPHNCNPTPKQKREWLCQGCKGKVTEEVNCNCDLGKDRLIRGKPYPTPTSKDEEWKKSIKEMLQAFETLISGNHPDYENANDVRETILAFIQTLISKSKQEGREEEREEIKRHIGSLRQWLNEDRITDPKKMVTNEQIKNWLDL